MHGQERTIDRLACEKRRRRHSAAAAGDAEAGAGDAYAEQWLEHYAELWQSLSDNGRASLEGRFTSQVATSALREALTASLGDWDREAGG